jgi:hypothetical protein
MGYVACSGQSPHPAGPSIGYDPCYLAQNAMRPCNSGQPQAPKPVGVDPAVVGTWELMVPNQLGISRWIWDIHRDGTYNFRAEGPGAAPAHSGAFAASKGRYALDSKTLAWNDTGTYRLVESGKMVAKGRLGEATWQRVQAAAAANAGKGK